MNLTKTLITQLNNCYIDCSFTNSITGNTNIINIETPNPAGDDVRSIFTIRTKDGFALKYDENTGRIVYRFEKAGYNNETLLPDILKNYNNYFSEYTFDLKNLSTYVNVDPVIEYKPDTYKRSNGDNGTINVPLIEWADIEEQKENIIIIPTGIELIGSWSRYPLFIISYFGTNPKKCKIGLAIEKFRDEDGRLPHYAIRTQSGRLFDDTDNPSSYGADEYGMNGKLIPGIVSISVNAEQVGEVIEEDNTDGLFSTYIVNQSDLKKIADTGKIYSEIIINTFSYPLKFNDEDLLETNIVLGNTPVEDLQAKRFQIAEPKIKIFSFNVPYLKDVESCKLLLPFNQEIILDYDIIRGKLISGYIQYEVSTNSSTLYIDNGDVEFYKDILIIETVVPFKPTGEYKNFKETEKRLGKQVPTLLIKCLQEEIQHHYMQGFIEYPIEGILKDELSLLNSELQKGVITNE